MHGAGRRRHAFTILEAILVVGILVVVAGAVVPLLADTQTQSLAQAARTEMATLRDACLRFRQDNRRFPYDLQELCAVTSTSTWDPDSRRGWRGPYVHAPRPADAGKLADPWDAGPDPADPTGVKRRWYVYGPEGTTGGYWIVSTGPDGANGSGPSAPLGTGDDLVERFR